ncbi:MAG TPA: Crp/Fnr family transcriptional regulator [Geminicoccus sp.]|uniref:Crp/Fnr family transcriptional regulator n=1 Tax=Geminicoccus sp. TaxID=2024832 RepID=UPI002BCAEA92|nr:Crp/Fnr family transcriptional regulator [Geminicoccus sp.]HWL68946.1 Crp/Fnr family transcriptional regulator [Geminicoccus sp.]
MALKQSAVRNHLLTMLPAEEFAALEPFLVLVDLPARQLLQHPNEPVGALYFVESGWISLLMALQDGSTVDIGMVGREGMIGTPLLLGSDRSIVEAMVQRAGSGIRLDAQHAQDALRACPSLQQLLMHFALALMTQVGQLVACNRHHPIEQRLICWLLMAHDRSDDDQLPMTHEALATTLGVRRASISLAAGALQKADLIRYASGRITILDRAGLEAAACECYRVVDAEYLRLLGRGVAS